MVITNDIIVLFEYIVKNPTKKQSYKILSENTKIPMSTIKLYVKWFKEDKYNSFIYSVARRYGYSVRLPPKNTKGVILIVFRSININNKSETVIFNTWIKKNRITNLIKKYQGGI